MDGAPQQPRCQLPFTLLRIFRQYFIDQLVFFFPELIECLLKFFSKHEIFLVISNKLARNFSHFNLNNDFRSKFRCVYRGVYFTQPCAFLARARNALAGLLCLALSALDGATFINPALALACSRKNKLLCFLFFK